MDTDAFRRAGLRQFGDAWRCIGEAMTTVETTNERWFEAEVVKPPGVPIDVITVDENVSEVDPARNSIRFSSETSSLRSATPR